MILDKEKRKRELKIRILNWIAANKIKKRNYSINELFFLLNLYSEFNDFWAKDILSDLSEINLSDPDEK